MIRQERSFRELGVENIDIVCDVDERIHPYELFADAGVDIPRVLWLPLFYTNRKVMPSQFTRKEFEAALDLCDYIITEERDKVVYVHRNTVYKMIAGLDKFTGNFAKVSYYAQNSLLRVEYYTDSLLYSVHYAKTNNSAHRCFMRYYDKNGKIVCDEYMPKSSSPNYEHFQSTWRFSNNVFYTKRDLVECLLRDLDLSEENDILIVNRNYVTGMIGRRFYKNLRVYYQYHAINYSPAETENDGKYLITSMANYARHMMEYTGSIVATESQKNDLVSQSIDIYGKPANVYVIPVGSLDRLYYPKENERQRHAFVSAARLNAQKGHDLAIKAIVKARETISDVRLDIYGSGPLKNMYIDMISRLGASEYIRLKGFEPDMNKVYKTYDGLILASGEEGCSCVCMEAIGSGCGLISFDNARYHGHEFICDGYTGCAAHIEINDCDDDDRIDALANAIIRYCQNESIDYHANAYHYAARYLTSEVTKLWKDLLADAGQLS